MAPVEKNVEDILNQIEEAVRILRVVNRMRHEDIMPIQFREQMKRLKYFVKELENAC